MSDVNGHCLCLRLSVSAGVFGPINLQRLIATKQESGESQSQAEKDADVYQTPLNPVDIPSHDDEAQDSVSQNDGDESFQTVTSLDLQNEIHEQYDKNSSGGYDSDNISDESEKQTPVNSVEVSDGEAQDLSSQHDEDESVHTTPIEANSDDMVDNSNANISNERINYHPIGSVSRLDLDNSMPSYTAGESGSFGFKNEPDNVEVKRANNKTEILQAVPSISTGPIPSKDVKLLTPEKSWKEGDPASSKQDFEAEVLSRLDAIQETQATILDMQATILGTQATQQEGMDSMKEEIRKLREWMSRDK